MNVETERTPQLIRDVLTEASRLARLEVALAREDLKVQIKQARSAGIALGSASALGVSGFTMLLVSLGLAFSKAWLATLIVAGAVGAVAGAFAFAGWRAMPRKPFGPTKSRLETDLKQLGGKKP